MTKLRILLALTAALVPAALSARSVIVVDTLGDASPYAEVGNDGELVGLLYAAIGLVGGALLVVVAAALFILRAKHARNARRLTEKRGILIGGLFDAVPVAMGVLDVRADVVEVVRANGLSSSWLGLSMGARIGPSLGTEQERAALGIWRFHLQQAGLSRLPVYFEQGVDDGGNSRGLSCVLACIGEVRPGTMRYSYAAHDVSRQRKAERDLQQNEARYCQILDATADLVILKNRESQIVWANRAFRDFHRIDDPRTLRESSEFDERIGIEQRLQEDRRVLDDGVRFDATEQLIRRWDGAVRMFHTVKTPIADDHGRVDLIVVVARDITERRQHEELIGEQQQKMAESARLAALGEVAGEIAHEIGSPLTVIQARARHIQNALKADPPDLARAIELSDVIASSVKMAASVVHGVRTVVRNADNDPFVDVPLASVIETVQILCEHRLQLSSVRFSVHGFQGLLVRGRETQLAQVLLNLVNNACDAVENCPEKWVRLEAKAARDLVEVSVVDSGRGIPIDRQRQLFRPFFTSKAVGKGTGLGLSISRGIIEAHGGRIALDMKCPNTCFKIELPRAVAIQAES